MTNVKETSRPIGQHRPSFSSGQSILPRNSLPRANTYSSSLGSHNPLHRVTRRKSSNLSPAAISAAVQAVNEVSARRSYLSPPNSLPPNTSLSPKYESALVDGPPLSSILEKPAKDNRFRRASDGSTLASGKKKVSGHGDLKCETCGKGYKHSSCLTKHLWEHTPEWAITSKLLISKHQQVQLLEAASVLVTMNQENAEIKSSDSEQSYESPAASGSDDREDSVSSIGTTPPPHGEFHYGHQKKISNASSAYSRSYQSIFARADRPYGHSRQYSGASHRPDSKAGAQEDQADLAAAVGLLSCSHGTPQVGPTSMTDRVPPVPPLPEKYQSLPRTVHDQEVDMGDVSSSDDDSSERPRSRHEEDDRIFGEMDE